LLTSVDTNVVLRRIVRDDPAQLELAIAVFASGGVYITRTVLVEVEWVLRSVYKWQRARVIDALEQLIHIEGVILEDEARSHWAIDRYRAGADLADMLHLAASHVADRFATFDTGVAPRAGQEPGILIDTLIVGT
jgi:predicted nucleic-acid-binding protein